MKFPRKLFDPPTSAIRVSLIQPRRRSRNPDQDFIIARYYAPSPKINSKKKIDINLFIFYVTSSRKLIYAISVGKFSFFKFDWVEIFNPSRFSHSLYVALEGNRTPVWIITDGGEDTADKLDAYNSRSEECKVNRVKITSVRSHRRRMYLYMPDDTNFHGRILRVYVRTFQIFRSNHHHKAHSPFVFEHLVRPSSDRSHTLYSRDTVVSDQNL